MCPLRYASKTLIRPGDGIAGVMTAWGRLQPLIQGPLGDVVLASRIAYWPDKHGTGGRQLGAALKSRDAALTDPAAKQRGLFEPAYVDHLLADPNGELTPLRGNKLWQLGLLELWLQAHGIAP